MVAGATWLSPSVYLTTRGQSTDARTEGDWWIRQGRVASSAAVDALLPLTAFGGNPAWIGFYGVSNSTRRSDEQEAGRVNGVRRPVTAGACPAPIPR